MLIPMSIVMEPDDLAEFNEVIWHTHEDEWLADHDSHQDLAEYDSDPDQDPEIPLPPTPHPGPPKPSDPFETPPGDPVPQPPKPGGPGPVNPDVREPVEIAN